MKKYLFALVSLLLLACKPETNKPAYYFNLQQQDSLVTNIITYVAENATYATDSTRFQPAFRSYYAKQLTKYTLVNLTKDPSGIYYYFLVRPVGNLKMYRRGVVGSFTLDSASLMPKNFKEIINTPHLSEELVLERGAFLFRELAKKGNISEYMVMRDYVEWPDSTLSYNTHTNRWVYHQGK
jgi:hypothetical protein